MAICEYCGAVFDPKEAEEDFLTATGLVYNNLRKSLCGECAIEAVEAMHDDVYFETCELCGKQFDLFSEEVEFGRNFPDYNGVGLQYYWRYGIMCSDCALQLAFSEEENHNYEEDIDTSERISVYDAADIWASNGKDEDYTFGYSVEDLEDALNSF